MILVFLLLVVLSIFTYLVYAKKRYYTFLIFAILYFLCSSEAIQFDVATSVVPGWHTTIYSSPRYLFYLYKYGIITWLLLITIAYWAIDKRNINFDNRIFLLHVLTTIPTLLFILIPVTMLFYRPGESGALMEMYRITNTVMSISYYLFFCRPDYIYSLLFKENITSRS